MARVLSFGLVSVCVSLALGSCAVDPYCFDCVDESLDSGRPDGGPDSGRDAGDTGVRDVGPTDTNPPDAWNAPDGCAVGATELCNGHDDDCDLMIDEGVNTTTDIDNCGSCGHRCLYAHAFADCTASTCSMSSCAAGYFDIDHDATTGCEYHCVSTGAEICDRRDNNCDGVIDEGFDFMSDPMNCGICGRVCNLAHTTGSACSAGACAIGACMPGFVDRDGVAANGCEYSCTVTGVETCNRIDDNCDGNVDEGDPGGGGSCGSSVGICSVGVQHCVGGGLTCMGGVSPGVESCNNMDDDCDGVVDDGNPGGGPSCGPAVGACVPGRLMCNAGSLMCQGDVGPTTETCDGLDNDCDGVTDNGDPGSGGACGTGVGQCTQGVQHCTGGSLSCMGGTGPSLESCNGLDDDCDGVNDNGFDFQHDVRNCGGCGTACSFPHAVAACVPFGATGRCEIVACAGGYVNLDASTTNANGCEYMCQRTSSGESCNGLDDNCNGTIDEGVSPPANFCRQAGVCMGSTATCMGTSGFVCSYTTNPNYEPIETRCDLLDNDCDGLVNEPFPLLGTACNNGELGACRRPGLYQCNGTSAIMCNAPSGASSSMAETCNGVDDNCNGMLDEGTSARGTWARVRPVGGLATGVNDYWIMSYEASRPDADTATQGILANVACSEPSRLPWTTVTPAQAAAACTAAGGALCTEAQWQQPCVSSAGTACTWSETAACTAFSTTACNGADFDAATDALQTTSARSATCSVPWSTTVGAMTFNGTIYNMSGNAEEWTAPRVAGVNPIRGGSYNDAQGGMTCGFNFEVAGNTIALPNVGFRCCRTTAP